MFAVVLVAAAWILARPYIGLRHDGALYLGQILLQWHPEIYSQDLFFQFGSQDRFSIVAPVLANVYRHVDFALTQIVIVTISQLAVTLVGLAFLRRAGATPTECVLGLVALGVMAHNYGGWAIFSFSERFVTGRSFAEPIALLGLLLVERNRVLAGVLALAVSMAFHPLVAIPVTAVAWGLLVVRDRRWAWALVALPVVVGLGVAQIDPFSRLLSVYDEEWLKAVRIANGLVFLTKWPLTDFAAVVFDCAILWAAARMFPALGPLLRVTVIATAALYGISAHGVDVANNILISQLQLWRVHWVAHFLVLPLLPALLLRTWRPADPVSHILVFIVAATAVAVNVRYSNSVALLVCSAAALALYVKRPPISASMLVAARAATAFALVSVSILVVLEAGTQLLHARGELGLKYLILLAVTAPALSLPVAYMLIAAWGRGRIASAGALALVVAAAAFGIANWDQRPPWTRYLEEHLRVEHPWEKLIAPTDEVLWWDQAEQVWGLLHRKSYYSVLQGAGILFNRGTAIEHQWRAKVAGSIQFQRDVCELMFTVGADGVDSECWPTMEAVEDTCRNDARLSYVVVNRKLARGAIADWTPLPNGTTYHLHDCKQIR